MSNLVIQGGRLNKQYSTSMLDSAIAIITTPHRGTVFQPRSAISRSSVSQPNRRGVLSIIRRSKSSSSAVVYLVLIDRYLITECSITPFPRPPHQPLAPRTPRRSLARLQKVSNHHPFATPPAEKETNLLRGDTAQTETESNERRGNSNGGWRRVLRPEEWEGQR